jgi:sec-independent protein translocase protein TatC
MALVPFPGSKSGALQKPTPEEEEDDSASGKMSFLEHLDELRKRIINACIGIGVGIVLSFFFIQRIFDFLLAPARQALPPGSHLIYTQPGEAFFLYMTVSLIAGGVIAAPYLMLQVWLFIAPGLYANEKKFAIPFVALSTLCFLAGAAFSHYIAYPFMITFFGSFNAPDLQFMPKLSDVFSLYTRMLLASGVMFEMPTVVFFLAKLRLVTARFLIRHFKYAVLLIFIAAAIITPTADPMGQLIFAGPMMALYAFSIGVAWLARPRKKQESVD